MQILQKQLEAGTHCPLCAAAMYWIEAQDYERDLSFHECSHCNHQIYTHNLRNCHCTTCQQQRKKMMQQTRQQEYLRNNKHDAPQPKLEQLSFMKQLFLLSLLDNQVQSHLQHAEYIDWKNLKYQNISPNYWFQKQIFENLIQDGVFIPRADAAERYDINVAVLGYTDPSLFYITEHLRQVFLNNLRNGVPYHNETEVKDALHVMLYQELIQFMQLCCKTWGVQIASSRALQSCCMQLLEHLAVGQVYYLIQNALDYLHKQNALQARNDNFINSNLLKKTLQQYRERGMQQGWETVCLPRSPLMPMSKMSQILFYQFLGCDDDIFMQPMWKAWKVVAPRLQFYAKKRCMNCGSNDLDVDYDAKDYVSLKCKVCGHQDHYFIE